MTLALMSAAVLRAQSNSQDKPAWWNKYQALLKSDAGTSLSAGANVEVSNERGPQSEIYIAINPASPSKLAARSNGLPMRGYFSSDKKKAGK